LNGVVEVGGGLLVFPFFAVSKNMGVGQLKFLCYQFGVDTPDPGELLRGGVRIYS
jgi:hypothetical protein